MPYDIVLSDTPQFSPSTENDFTSSFWSFLPATNYLVSYEQGNAVPGAVNIATVIENYLNGIFGTQYASFLIRTEIVVSSGIYGTIDDEVAVLSGAIADDQPAGYVLTQENLEVVNTITLQNLSLLQSGVYNVKINFYVFGVDGSGEETLIDTKYWSMKLIVSGEVVTEDVDWDPKELYFEHVRNEALPATQAVEITASGNFTFKLSKKFTLTGLTLVTEGLLFNTYSGNGDTTVQIGLSASFDTLAAGVHVGSYYGIDTGAIISSNLPGHIYASLFEDSTITLDPSSLEFFAVKGIIEADPQFIDVLGPGAVAISSAPAWLFAEVVIDGYNKQIKVTPVPSDNLSAGEYSGTIIANINGDDYEIDVIHTVYENVQLGMSESKLNFTDDHETISWFYELDEFRVSLGLGVKAFNYGINTFQEKDITYLLGIFNNRTKFFIGQSVERYMKELNDVEQIGLNTFSNQFPQDSIGFFRKYYNPAEINLQVDFIHKSDEALNHSSSFEDIRFLKGRKPKTAFDNTFILNFYRDDLRVTVNSVALFNFYKESSHQLRVYKNGEFELGVDHAPGFYRSFAYKHTFENYSEGDVIEIRLYQDTDGTVDDAWFEDSANYISQRYIVFPESLQSFHIGWENEYGVLEVMEFTGEFSFPLAYDNKVVDSYEVFVESLKKVDVKKTQKLSANTGFILKENFKRIDSLLESKRAWVISKDLNPVIELVPIDKKYDGPVSDLEVYQKTIEFEINLNANAEIYS